MSKAEYDASSITRMSEVEHIRKHSSMYIGDTADATHLISEIIDNSLDEVVNGGATIVGVYVDTKNSIYSILDNGRGIPADPSKPEDLDPAVMICRSLHTSGKFEKSGDAAYGVAIGLHGIGLSACYALSHLLILEIFRDNTHYKYTFTYDGRVERFHEPYTDRPPYATKVIIKPHENYFKSTGVDLTKIEDRLVLASAMYPKLKAVLKVDGGHLVIDFTLNDILKKYLADPETWIELEDKVGPEHYKVKIAWDPDGSNAVRAFGVVNLVRVDEGSHITRVVSTLKDYFAAQGKKNKLTFQDNDSCVGLRVYVECAIIESHFQSQIKTKLASNSGLNVFNSFNTKLEKYFEKNHAKLMELIERFHHYRHELQQKKVIQDRGTKRGSTKFTKLRDCTQPGGELIIGEGDSAVGGLFSVRNPAKHAILPLRGVVPNAVTKKEFYKNKEFADIIDACGTGILKQCDVSKLRYSKILLCADADSAGEWITVLLIILFAFTMPDIIKNGRLYVCKTPLYGARKKGVFTPIWTEEELADAKKGTDKIFRFKGLGEINPKDLATLVINEKSRKLIQVQWSKNSDKLFELLASSEEKRKLVMGEWAIE